MESVFKSTKSCLVVLIFLIFGSSSIITHVASHNDNLQAPPPNWKEHWYDHNQNLDLVYSDDHVVFYFDSDVNRVTNKILVDPVSESWQFIKSIYNDTALFWGDTRLFVVLHEQKHVGIRFTTHTDKSHDFRNVVECGQNRNNSQCSLGAIIKHISNLAHDLLGRVEAVESTKLISGWRMLDIMIYDKLLESGRSEAADSLRSYITGKSVDLGQESNYLFRDWYLPIYEGYGGSKIIQRFLGICDMYEKQVGTGGKLRIPPGALVHLWSEATGTDLRDLAYKAIGWVPDYRSQFLMARKKFPSHTYTDVFPNASSYKPPDYWEENWHDHKKNLTLTLFDGDVAYYLEDSIVKDAHWFFQQLTAAWRYVKKTYGKFGHDSVLYVILHQGNQDECRTSKLNSFLDKEFDNRIVIDCVQANYNGWDDLTAVNLDFIIEEVARVTHSVVKETGFYTEFNVSIWAMLDIMAYDIYVGIDKTEDAERFKQTKLGTTVASPRPKVYWFREWYFPIYSRCGKYSLNTYFNILYANFPRNGTDYAKLMNLGEFIHFWSGATYYDLTHLAMKTFGWSSEIKDQLAQARVDYPQVDYQYDKTPPLQWREHWHLRWRDPNYARWNYHWHKREDELPLVYLDDHIAFYVDENANKNLTWAFHLMSDSWKYIKETYSPLRNEDPLLYILLHEDKYSECRTSKVGAYFDRGYDNRNVMDCGLLNLTSRTTDSVENRDKLMKELGYMILRNVEESGNWQGYRSARWSMAGMLAYDIYLGIGQTENANRWKNEQMGVTEVYPHTDTYWFRDWYYPIYEKYGGVKVYKEYFIIIKSFWPQDNNEYGQVNEFDLGTMVHLWSGAVGENLWYLASNAFNLGAWNHKKFLKARIDIPEVKYSDTYQNATVTSPPETWNEHWSGHQEELKLVHLDAHVAIYFDSQMDFSDTWIFEPASDAWGYAKMNYGPFGQDPFLYIVLHDGSFPGCRSSRDGEGGSYIDAAYENQTVVDCGRLYTSWARADGMDDLMGEMGVSIIRGAKKTGNWPSWSVSKWDMANILGYDIYLGIGKTKEASKWLQKRLEPETKIPKKDVFWLRDWYYPIYTKYGEGKVLGRFLSLLYQHWPKASTGYDYAAHLNMGEYVHFWSGAAGVNLQDLAYKAIRWTAEHDMELENARKQYTEIRYSDSRHILASDDQPLLINENWFGHKHHLFQAYADPLIAIYYDAHVDRSIKWPLALLPKVWHHARQNYNTTETSEGSSLKVVLHSKEHSGCRSIWNETYGIHIENIIDCGKDSGKKWTEESRENSDELFKEFINIIKESAQQTNAQDALSQLMLVDTYLQVGKYKEAMQFLDDTIKNEIRSGSDKYLIRDWYLPIYLTYGGVSVINKFLYILSTNWGEDTTRKMNTGILVHFWSAAAGRNLFELAEDTFKWNSHHPEVKQFNEARQEFSDLKYSCFNCYISEPEVHSNFLSATFTIGVACVVVAIVGIALMVYRFKISKLEQEIRELTSDEIKEFFEGRAQASQSDGANYTAIESKPFNQDYEIPRDRLEISIDKVLGAGEYGIVVRGFMKEPGEDQIETPVAVKTVKPNVDISCFKALLTELKVMGHLGMHENIASLLGAYTLNIRKREVYVAIEFCSNGDLLGFMKKYRTNFQDLFGNKTDECVKDRISKIKACEAEPEELAVTISDADENNDEPARQFSSLDLLKWSHHIANGMAYIATKKVVHGDLAARNVLLTADNVAKISDFGLSRQLANYSNYMKTSKTPVPWRWMSIEALRDMNFSSQSDVWAFGVTLYEMFSLGTVPYAGWAWDYEFIDKLVAGHRLSSPEFGNADVYCLMMECMKKEPADRITFPELHQKLKVLASQYDTQAPSDPCSNYARMSHV